MYLYTFIRGIIFKLSGQRCQRQVSPNTESPWQNNPNKFPCGRKQITQELGWLSTHHDDLFTHTELHISVSHDLCLYWLVLFLRKKQTDLSDSKQPHPPVSALLRSLMTAEWGPHYWEELACDFTTHFLSVLSNNKCQPPLWIELHHVLV